MLPYQPNEHALKICYAINSDYILYLVFFFKNVYYVLQILPLLLNSSIFIIGRDILIS